jgi:hypothetical protein
VKIRAVNVLDVKAKKVVKNNMKLQYFWKIIKILNILWI